MMNPNLELDIADAEKQAREDDAQLRRYGFVTHVYELTKADTQREGGPHHPDQGGAWVVHTWRPREANPNTFHYYWWIQGVTTWIMAGPGGSEFEIRGERRDGSPDIRWIGAFHQYGRHVGGTAFAYGSQEDEVKAKVVAVRHKWHHLSADEIDARLRR